ncbi:MAG: dTDP-4-dehydrorhamnose 3,5-epimerase [Acidobacteria bacterium]|nr:dTDP-4-dehydrorhamnose 3,5-epimerase [Acidobacteriota bacterium]
MEVERAPIEGLKIVRLKLREDDRGFFVERFRSSTFAAEGLPGGFLQDNHSRSQPGVLRGLHYQHAPPQGKLVGVTRGRIWDVAVDIRPESATFGESFGLELNDNNGLLLWIPPGFAHGFCVLGDSPADVVYKATSEYNPASDEGILWSDPELAIDWPITSPSLSERDRSLQSFQQYKGLAMERRG